MQPPLDLSVESNKVCYFNVHFMALNKLQELGLLSSAPPSFAWVTLLELMILPYFFIALTMAQFCFSYMWMI